MAARFSIGGHPLGEGRTFVIAEAGVNHNGSVDTAVRLVEVAAAAGADAVKFQTFHTESLVTRNLEKAPYQADNTGAGTQFEMIKRLELDAAAHRELAAACEAKGIVFLSTPFYEGGVDLLDALGVPAIKVDSGNVTNWPLLDYIARRGRPVILSTGMSTLAEVDEAVAVLRAGGADVCLLHCTSNYPARLGDVHLRAMETLRRAFDCPVGYSDHTAGIGVAIAAVACGAAIIEKHFTLDRDAVGPDHKASLLPHELTQMITEIRNVEKALGSTVKRVQERERSTIRALRRSLVAAVDVTAGTVISRGMVAIKRPGDGIAPRYLEWVVGRTALRDILADQPFSWDDL